MDTLYSINNTYFGEEEMSLRDLIHALRNTYCGNLGVEYMYITDPAENAGGKSASSHVVQPRNLIQTKNGASWSN